MLEKNLTTYCGIYCGDCPRYKAKFSDMCSDLLDEFEDSNFSKLAKKEKGSTFDSSMRQDRSNVDLTPLCPLFLRKPPPVNHPEISTNASQLPVEERLIPLFSPYRH